MHFENEMANYTGRKINHLITFKIYEILVSVWLFNLTYLEI